MLSRFYQFSTAARVHNTVIRAFSTTTTANKPNKTEDHIPSVAVGNDVVTAMDVMAAYQRIKTTVTRSPLDYSESLSRTTGCKVYLKKEHSASPTGSYKERGALNKLLQLSPEERERGVICSSAGNHAQAVSYHSTRLGIDGVICMPQTTPHIKVSKTASFGGRVVLAGESFADAYNFAREMCTHENRTFIHAFDDAQVVAGAGTVAVEMIEQNPFLDAIIVPVGGGGLIAGMSVFIKSINPRIKVYGVEAAAMPGVYRSIQAGHVVPVPKRGTMADGIAIENVGETPFSLIHKYVDEIVLVEEDELAGAVLTMLEVEKTVLEAAGAAAIAGLVQNKFPDLAGKNVGVVCTGSNIDMALLSRIITKGLVKSGRMARISVTIRDEPGQLAKICSICNDLRVNIVEIKHERAFLLDTVGVTQPVIDVETKGFDHINKLLEALRASDFIDCHVVTPFH